MSNTIELACLSMWNIRIVFIDHKREEKNVNHKIGFTFYSFQMKCIIIFQLLKEIENG